MLWSCAMNNKGDFLPLNVCEKRNVRIRSQGYNSLLILIYKDINAGQRVKQLISLFILEVLLKSGVAEPCFWRLAGPKIQLAIFKMVKETTSQNVT